MEGNLGNLLNKHLGNVDENAHAALPMVERKDQCPSQQVAKYIMDVQSPLWNRMLSKKANLRKICRVYFCLWEF